MQYHGSPLPTRTTGGHRLFGLMLSLLAGCVLYVCGANALADPAGNATSEVRDVILLLEQGPLHLRFHVAIGGKSPLEARRESLARLLKQLDVNGDGKLSRQEADRSPLFREKQRPKAEAFLQEIGAARAPADIAQRFERLGGETVVYRQNIATAESDTAVFKLLDENGDGVIDVREVRESIDLLLASDTDDDECVTLDELAPTPDPQVATGIVQPDAGRMPTVSMSEILRDTNQSLLPAQMLQKYDKNRDQKLSAAELGWPAERLAACDADRDRQLNVKELAKLNQSAVDIELAVDLVHTDGAPMLRVLKSSGSRTDGDRFPDLATISLPAAVVTFSSQEVDPFEASMKLALRTFNELDTDANGYLDRDETMARERFARGLFDQIDADGDGKIFGEEMKEFIRARGEPVAMTCQITIHDDGAGFFSALDANSDRRLSLREMRYADKSLAIMERDERPGLSLHEPARRYRVEFERGVFNPFGATARIPNAATTAPSVATAKPRAVGPIWFQRWDRNNDGDLSWREFLGPRDAFEELDVDQDDLIDAKEAEAAARMATKPPRTRSTRGSSSFSTPEKPDPALSLPGN